MIDDLVGKLCYISMNHFFHKYRKEGADAANDYVIAELVLKVSNMKDGNLFLNELFNSKNY